MKKSVTYVMKINCNLCIDLDTGCATPLEKGGSGGSENFYCY